MARQIFYSFHYKPDVMRVSQVRNIGALEGTVNLFWKPQITSCKPCAIQRSAYIGRNLAEISPV